MNKSLLSIGIITLAILFGIGFYSYRQENTPGKLDSFAQCLKDKGVIFYGAFWCPHCQAQKALFGRSAKLLPYFECSTPDGKSQLPVCTEKGIKGYPTWVFPDESRIQQEATLAQLAEKTSCELPKNE